MVEVFFSYSHEDESYRNDIEKHLMPLVHEKQISTWHDRRIVAGEEIDQEISGHLETSEIILLLISANFVASRYCYGVELKRALEKHAEGTAILIPVIVHDCDWHNLPFGHLMATPTEGKPISLHGNLHEALTIVARDVRRVIEDRMIKQGKSEGRFSQQENEVVVTDEVRSSNMRIQKELTEHERDTFLLESYEYIKRYFAGSLEELKRRNPEIESRHRTHDANSFSAVIYQNGSKACACTIWLSANGAFQREATIAYSNSENLDRNSFNEQLNFDGHSYTPQLKPLGLLGSLEDESLTKEGAAEHLWSSFISPLQE